jgi:hypothetical protein
MAAFMRLSNDPALVNPKACLILSSIAILSDAKDEILK